MKKIILSALTALMVVGCGFSVERDTKACIRRYHVIILDSCEYYSNTMTYDLTHKGNCRFCKERRQNELEEWVIRCKTPLKVTYKDGVVTDTVVVFKDKKK